MWIVSCDILSCDPHVMQNGTHMISLVPFTLQVSIRSSAVQKIRLIGYQYPLEWRIIVGRSVSPYRCPINLTFCMGDKNTEACK